MIQASGIDHVVLHVSDVQRSKRFYTELLGMTAYRENDTQVFLHAGGQGIALFKGPGDAAVHAGGDLNHLALNVASGTYETLLDYAMFALWISYALMVAGMMVLRHKQPQLERPYRMWGYPVTPLLFLAVAVGFLGNTLIEKPGPSVAGLLLIATGVPVYFMWRKSARRIAEPGLLKKGAGGA